MSHPAEMAISMLMGCDCCSSTDEAEALLGSDACPVDEDGWTERSYDDESCIKGDRVQLIKRLVP